MAERLRKEVERKVILSPNQTGFRMGMGIMDNIYILNYLINRQVERKQEGIIIMYVDFKAAFKSMNRKKW